MNGCGALNSLLFFTWFFHMWVQHSWGNNTQCYFRNSVSYSICRINECRWWFPWVYLLCALIQHIFCFISWLDCMFHFWEFWHFCHLRIKLHSLVMNGQTHNTILLLIPDGLCICTSVMQIYMQIYNLFHMNSWACGSKIHFPGPFAPVKCRMHIWMV